MNKLFGALDISEIPEFPADGTHEYVLRDLRTVKTQAGANKLVMEFVLDDESSPFNGDKFTKWFNLSWLDGEGVTSVAEFDARMLRDFNVLRDWLRKLNVPEDELDTIEFSQLTGTRVLGYGYKREKWNKTGYEYVLANIEAV